jgi:mono-ADP-ribosyltransferase sirtuin 6
MVQHCSGRLVDFVLDWEDALPEEQLQRAEKEADKADLILCLGTSLQITPICNLPLRTKRNGGKFVIVNLQKTPKNRHADLVIHGRCEEVIACVMDFLDRAVPTFVRQEAFELRCWAEDDEDVRH